MRICPQCREVTESDRCPNDSTSTVNLDREPPEMLQGKTLAGRYRIERIIGEGGMGVVYRAMQRDIERPVAVKVLDARRGLSEESRIRFEREARATSQLDHPNTVKIIDFGVCESGNLFYVMELLEGRSLKQVIRSGARLSVDHIVHIARQVGKSLAEAHSKGIFHRDLKPDNIFLKRVYGEPALVKVLDFGIAKVSTPPSHDDLTQTGVMMGTPKYMAPEQAAGAEVDARTDIYALGVILYELVAGHPPFVRATPMAYAADHMYRKPPPLSAPANDARRIALNDLVIRMLAKEPEERPARAEDVLAGLSRISSLAPDPDSTQVVSGEEGGRSVVFDLEPEPGLAETMTGMSGPPPTPSLRGVAGALDPRHRSLRPRWLAAAVAVVAVVAGIAVWSSTRPGSPVRPAEPPAAPPPAALATGLTEPVAAQPPVVAPVVAVEVPRLERVVRDAIPPETRRERGPPAAEIGRLRVRVETEPPRATVRAGGRRLGRAPVVVEWPSSDEPPRVEVRLSGYKTARVRPDPQGGGSMAVRLKRRPRRPRRPTGYGLVD